MQDNRAVLAHSGTHDQKTFNLFMSGAKNSLMFSTKWLWLIYFFWANFGMAGTRKQNTTGIFCCKCLVLSKKSLKKLGIIQLMKFFITFWSPIKVCHSAPFWRKFGKNFKELSSINTKFILGCLSHTLTSKNWNKATY